MTFTGHWWHEVILRPAKSDAKSLFACQNLAALRNFKIIVKHLPN
jgi:hypothetical protein